MEQDLETLTDLCTPWCVHVVATLRLADHIARGIDEIRQLAATAHCDAAALEAVLGHLVSKGVFDQPAPGRFALNDTSRGLLDPMVRIGLDLEGIGGRMAHAWGTMLDYVRTGEPAYHKVFGRPFWEDLDANPNVAASFDALIGPTGHGTPDPHFHLAGGWDAVRWVVDVGGGTGAMLAEILRTRPGVRGTLVDQPATAARAAVTFRVAGVSARVAAIGQSFFDPLPAGAGLYLLRGVLNDWPDREARAILTRCADAARPGGRVVVLKGIVADDEPKRLMVEMILAGGRERSVSEFTELARAAGLEVVAAGRQPAYFVVECKPV
jgi:2,7-dihydroxy-5-methyl-1-naphthoate 7-O-methyltransferase